MSRHLLKIGNFCASILVAIILLLGISSVNSIKTTQLKEVTIEEEDAEIQNELTTSSYELQLDGGGDGKPESQQYAKSQHPNGYIDTSIQNSTCSTIGCVLKAKANRSPYYILFCSLKLDTVSIL